MVQIDLRGAADVNRASADHPITDEAWRSRQGIDSSQQAKARRSVVVLPLIILKLNARSIDGVVGPEKSFDLDKRAYHDRPGVRPNHRYRSDVNYPAIDDPVSD